jgi:Cu/Ag efflux pump CusA
MEGARLRFRAILMTTISFVAGMVPLLVASGAGAASRWSLGTAVFSGMSMATVLSVFFIPVLYFAIESLMEKVRGPRAAPSAAKPAPVSQSEPEEGGGS